LGLSKKVIGQWHGRERRPSMPGWGFGNAIGGWSVTKQKDWGRNSAAGNRVKGAKNVKRQNQGK